MPWLPRIHTIIRLSLVSIYFVKEKIILVSIDFVSNQFCGEKFKAQLFFEFPFGLVIHFMCAHGAACESIDARDAKSERRKCTIIFVLIDRFVLEMEVENVSHFHLVFDEVYKWEKSVKFRFKRNSFALVPLKYFFSLSHWNVVVFAQSCIFSFSNQFSKSCYSLCSCFFSPGANNDAK